MTYHHHEPLWYRVTFILKLCDFISFDDHQIYNIITLMLLLYNVTILPFRVESGLDDPDNVGHLGNFFMGQVGLIRKLNYLDVTQIF